MEFTQLQHTENIQPSTGEWHAESSGSGDLSARAHCLCGEEHVFDKDVVEFTGHVEAPCGAVLVLNRWGLQRAIHGVTTQVADPKHGPWSRT